MRCLKWWTVIAGLAAACAMAQQPLMDRIDADAAKAWFASEFAEAQQAHADNSEVKVWRGVVANRQQRSVTVLALATGIKDEPIEFFLVAHYGRDYESLAVTMAKPSDIQAALRFIGMEPGHPVDFPNLLFWPKGERVTMTFHWEEKGEDGKPVAKQSRAEDMVLNQRQKATLPQTGLVFTGSSQVTEEGKDETRLGADIGGEIASDYNSQWTILDVPYRANQGELYGLLVTNPELKLTAGQHLRIELRPALPPGETQVRDFLVQVAPEGASAVTAADLRFTVRAGEAQPNLTAGTFENLLEFLMQQRTAGKDVFLSFAFAPDLTLGALREFAALLDAMADKEVVRIEPAPKELYYRAFLPDDKWRDRQNRIVQPLEIHLSPDGRRLVFIEEIYPPVGGRQLKEHAWPFTGPDTLTELVSQRETWPTDTVFLYVQPTTRYGDMLAVLNPVRERFPIVYVYPAAPAQP